MKWRTVPLESINMAELDKIVKVKMAEGGYDQTHGKMREGGVYEFPQEQAVRYVRAGVAKPASAGAKTAREEDRAHLLKDAKARAHAEELDAEMSAAWDVDVRDIGRAEFEAEAAERHVEEATEAVKRAQDARKLTSKAAASPEPGPVNTQGPR